MFICSCVCILDLKGRVFGVILLAVCLLLRLRSSVSAEGVSKYNDLETYIDTLNLL